MASYLKYKWDTFVSNLHFYEKTDTTNKPQNIVHIQPIVFFFSRPILTSTPYIHEEPPAKSKILDRNY
jgi:hypothetical protein